MRTGVSVLIAFLMFLAGSAAAQEEPKYSGWVYGSIMPYLKSQRPNFNLDYFQGAFVQSKDGRQVIGKAKQRAQQICSRHGSTHFAGDNVRTVRDAEKGVGIKFNVICYSLQ